MAKFTVTMPYSGSLTFTEVEAADEDAAIERVLNEVPAIHDADLRPLVKKDKLGANCELDTQDIFSWQSDDAEADCTEEDDEDDDTDD